MEKPEASPTKPKAASRRRVTAAASPAGKEKGRRGRPTLEQAEAIGKQIRDIAQAMFFELGYSATAMEAIAAKAGMSKGTLYNRFPQKADLFAAIVEDRVQAWSLRSARKRHRVPKTLREVLEHHAMIALDAVADPEVMSFAELLAAERRRFPELARIYHDRAVMLQIGLSMRDIEEACDREKIVIANPREMAFALMEATWGWASIRTFGNDRDSSSAMRAAAAKRIAAVMIDGIEAWK